LFVAEFSPVARSSLTAVGPAELGFDGTWLAVETGENTAAPPSPTPVTNRYDDMKALRPSDIHEPWAIALAPHADHVVRVQDAGAAKLVEVVRGPNHVRSLWWCSGTTVACARKRLASRVCAEVLADGVAVLFDPDARRLELFRARAVDAAVAVDLPSVIEPVEYPGHERVLAALRPAGVLVIQGHKRSCWMRIGELLAAEDATQIEWDVTWCFPGADPAARLTGTVTMCRYGVTNVQFPGRKLQLHDDLGAPVGTTVTLVGRLWDTLGAVQYREIEFPDGSRRPMSRVPVMATTLTSKVERIRVVTPEVEIPAELIREVRALRAEGLLGDMTDDELVSYVEGIDHTNIVEIVLRYYEHDELGRERARGDRFLVHDGRFEQETDDVIAELCELIGEPLFVQLGVDRAAIRVRGPRGDETIEVGSLGDVVSHVNAVLGENGHAARIVGLLTGDDRHAYFALPADRVARLREAGVPLVEIGG